jgi:hypothetical protein
LLCRVHGFQSTTCCTGERNKTHQGSTGTTANSPSSIIRRFERRYSSKKYNESIGLHHRMLTISRRSIPKQSEYRSAFVFQWLQVFRQTAKRGKLIKVGIMSEQCPSVRLFIRHCMNCDGTAAATEIMLTTPISMISSVAPCARIPPIECCRTSFKKVGSKRPRKNEFRGCILDHRAYMDRDN